MSDQRADCGRSPRVAPPEAGCVAPRGESRLLRADAFEKVSERRRIKEGDCLLYFAALEARDPTVAVVVRLAVLRDGMTSPEYDDCVSPCDYPLDRRADRLREPLSDGSKNPLGEVLTARVGARDRRRARDRPGNVGGEDAEEVAVAPRPAPECSSHDVLALLR